jgi:hypothetical protein
VTLAPFLWKASCYIIDLRHHALSWWALPRFVCRFFLMHHAIHTIWWNQFSFLRTTVTSRNQKSVVNPAMRIQRQSLEFLLLGLVCWFRVTCVNRLLQREKGVLILQSPQKSTPYKSHYAQGRMDSSNSVDCNGVSLLSIFQSCCCCSNSFFSCASTACFHQELPITTERTRYRSTTYKKR